MIFTNLVFKSLSGQASHTETIRKTKITKIQNPRKFIFGGFIYLQITGSRHAVKRNTFSIDTVRFTNYVFTCYN